MKIDIQDKTYNLKTKWDEITLEDADKLMRLDVPESLKELYEAKTKEDYAELYKGLSSKELIKEHPAFYGEVLHILSDVPMDVINLVGYEDRIEFYTNYVEQIFVDVFYLTGKSYFIKEIQSFTHKGNEYFLPETLKLFGRSIPMYKEKAMPFVEEADIMTSLSNLDGADGIAQLCAVMCREKEEDYDELKAIERAELFKDLPMSVVWEVFFYTLKQLNTSLTITNTFFKNQQKKELVRALECAVG